MELFWELQRELGATIVLVTHDGRLAATCERVLRISDGFVDTGDR